ncbi:MAG: SRPBCC family protein, partial [Actinomycetes bacterium]
EFDLPVDMLWAAWTDPVALEAWYHPTDLSVLPGSVTSDAVEGGLWTVGVDVPEYGFVAYFYGRYTAVVENARLEHTMAYTQSAEEFAARDEAAPHHHVVIEFEARGFRSWVKFCQFGEMPEGQAEKTQAGMESYFDSLEAYLTV